MLLKKGTKVLVCVGKDKGKDGEPSGLQLPYVVTIDESSGKILSIYRNFVQEDPLKKSRQHFVHYKFQPGLGFYGFGLIHLIGSIAKSSTIGFVQLYTIGLAFVFNVIQ